MAFDLAIFEDTVEADGAFAQFPENILRYHGFMDEGNRLVVVPHLLNTGTLKPKRISSDDFLQRIQPPVGD
jgi:hypothetical protein